MQALRERDYEEMADRVVDRFLRNQVKLAQGATEEAVQAQLNPDQIERLVQAANTMAFLRLMEARKSEGAPDLTHEFDPVDTRTVLQSIMGMVPDPEAHETGLQDALGGDPDAAPLPDETRSSRGPADEDASPPIKDDDGPFPKGDKQRRQESEKRPSKEPAKAPDKDAKKEAMVRRHRLEKLAAVFDDRLVEAEMGFDDAYDRLVRSFKLAHGAPGFDQFEKDAMSVIDDEHGVAVLDLVRRGRGLPRLEGNVLERCAALRDRHVADDYPALREFGTLVTIIKQATRLRNGVRHVRALCG